MNDYEVDAIEDGLAQGAQSANGSRGSPLDTSRWGGLPERVEVPRRADCNKVLIEKFKQKRKLITGEHIMNGNRVTLPPVHILAVSDLEPPAPNGNGKPAIFDELGDVALGICNFAQPEIRKQMMREANDLLDRGFVPIGSWSLDNDHAGFMLADSVRFKQLRPAMTARERTQERFDLWQKDQIIFGDEIAAQVQPAAEAAIEEAIS